MTKIKLCGLSKPCDIEAANALQPEYIGFVFAPKSKRYVSMEQAAALKKRLDSTIKAVGVFVNENPETTPHIWKPESSISSSFTAANPKVISASYEALPISRSFRPSASIQNRISKPPTKAAPTMYFSIPATAEPARRSNGIC